MDITTLGDRSDPLSPPSTARYEPATPPSAPGPGYLDGLAQHATLRLAAHRLERLAQSLDGQPHGLAVSSLLRVELSVFGQKLLLHFGYEENDGYLADVVRDRPELAPEVSRLLEDHARMREELRTLLVLLIDPVSVPEVSQRILGLVERLENHEAAESALLQDSVLTDLGEAG